MSACPGTKQLILVQHEFSLSMDWRSELVLLRRLLRSGSVEGLRLCPGMMGRDL